MINKTPLYNADPNKTFQQNHKQCELRSDSK